MPSFASTEPLYERSSPTIKFSFAISSPNHFGKSATIACRDAISGLSSKSFGSIKSRLAKGSLRRRLREAHREPPRYARTARELRLQRSRLAARKESNRVEITKVQADFEAATKRHEFIFAEGSGARLHQRLRAHGGIRSQLWPRCSRAHRKLRRL